MFFGKTLSYSHASTKFESRYACDPKTLSSPAELTRLAGYMKFDLWFRIKQRNRSGEDTANCKLTYRAGYMEFNMWFEINMGNTSDEDAANL
ncbi:hypothetical protein BGZ99_000985, partial [Dissophora globulifera]